VTTCARRELALHYQKLAVGGTQGQMLVAYRAEPGAASHERLLLLAGLADPAAQSPRWASRAPTLAPVRGPKVPPGI
jgi:hypothetical protein